MTSSDRMQWSTRGRNHVRKAWKGAVATAAVGATAVVALRSDGRAAVAAHVLEQSGKCDIFVV